jgi:hypothetical protein
MKKITFSALALVLGLGLAITQSSFKNRDVKRWGYNHLTGSFTDITNKTMDNGIDPAVGSYSCLPSGQVCSGDAESEPTDVSELSNQSSGTFRQN